MSEEPKRRPRSQLLIRLPLLLAIGLGIWLWKGGGGLLITERQLVFRMPQDRADLRRFEYQLFDEDGTLLKREEASFAGGAPVEFSGKAQLKEGAHSVRLFSWYDSPQPRVTTVQLAVSSDEQLLIDVPPR